jgi:hypothetical protein
VRARRTIDLHEIARPEILYAGRVEGDHLSPNVLFLFRIELNTGRATRQTHLIGFPSLRCGLPTVCWGRGAARRAPYLSGALILGLTEMLRDAGRLPASKAPR